MAQIHTLGHNLRTQVCAEDDMCGIHPPPSWREEVRHGFRLLLGVGDARAGDLLCGVPDSNDHLADLVQVQNSVSPCREKVT